jgi:GNAT superfamily N-acetyltransferase
MSGEPRPNGFHAATEHDVDDIVELVQAAYRGESSRQGWTTEADLVDGQRVDADMVRAAIAGDGVVVLLVEGGELLACCELRPLEDGAAYLGMFAVRPGHQGGGIGRRVIAHATEVAKGWGADRIRLTVIEQRTELIDWYKRLGYEPTGETEPFPYDDERFGRPLRDDLRFVVLEHRLR